MSLFTEQLQLLEQACPIEMRGTVIESRGLAVRVADLPAPVGASVMIDSRGGRSPGEVIGFDQDCTVVMPLGQMAGIRRGDRVTAHQFYQYVPAGRQLLGRVVNAMGKPIDGKGPLADAVPQPLTPLPIDPMERPPIDQPLATGVRAVDTLLSVGRGQRLGIFASPGLGKSTLLATMARHTSADITVIGMVGERGREVRDFIENQLGDEGMKQTVVVCATGDESPLIRIRAANVATAIAEHFRDHGKDVLLLIDSVTRFCQAQRQVGLAAGEPPATKGFPPSVFSLLPCLLERCGRTSRGSITGLYAVLVEGDELTDPISDAARGILDGHIQLSQKLANEGHWPAIDVLTSISRVANDVTDAQHQDARREVLRLVHHYREVEDLLNIGAYATGSNPNFDLAIAAKSAIDNLLRQGRGEVKGKAEFDNAKRMLIALMHNIQNVKGNLAQQLQRGRQAGQAAGQQAAQPVA